MRRILHGALMHTLLKLRGLLLLPVLARALGPSAMGVVTLGGALSGLLATALTLGVPLGASLMLSDLRPREAVARAFSTIARFSLGSAVLGTALTVALLGAPQWRPSAIAPLAPYAAELGAWLLLASVRELATLVPSLRQETGYLARLNVLTDYGGAVLAIVAVLHGHGPGAVFLSFAGGLALGVVPSLVRSWRVCGLAPGMDRSVLRRALGNGVPFLLIAFGQWALQSLDSLFLAALHGEAAVGVYGVSYTIASAVLLVLAVLNFFFFPTALSLSRRGVQALVGFFDASFRLATLALGLLLAEACLLGPWAVELLAGPPYREAGRILPLIVLSYSTFTYMQLLQFVPMVVERRSASVAACYLPAVLLNVALNFLLIPRWSLSGAAAATVLSYVAAALVMGRLAASALPAFRCWRPLLRATPVVALSSAMALAFAVDRTANVFHAAFATVLLAAGYAVLAFFSSALRPDDWRALRAAS